jgi:hypothetical protein
MLCAFSLTRDLARRIILHLVPCTILTHNHKKRSRVASSPLVFSAVMSTPPEPSDDVPALLASVPASPPTETARLLGEGDIEYGPPNYGALPPDSGRPSVFWSHVLMSFSSGSPSS